MDLQQNLFADLVPGQQQAPQAPPPQGPPAQPYTVGVPDRGRLAAEARAQAASERAARAEERSAAAAERSAANIPSGYRSAANGGLEPIPGGPADPNRPQPTAGSARLRQLPNQQQQRLETSVSLLSNLERARDSFQDNYGGNLIGGIENTLQSYNSHIGTPGQSQFWADVAATDNVARNALFGASLTEGEKAAWEATTISPSMDPANIRANLARRAEIVRASLGRIARTNAANGFNRDAIEAALGDYGDLLHQGEIEGAATQSVQGTARGAIVGAASGQGDANFPQQIQSAPQGSPERFQMLERYNNAVRAGDLPIFIGEESDATDGMGVTHEQRQQLLDEYQRELPNQQARQAREQFATDHPVLAGVDTVARSAANAMTLGLADRVAGTMNGTGPEAEHAITNTDWENRPLLSLGGTLGGGAVLPLPGSLGRQMLAGGAYGGVYGYNSRDGSQEDRLAGAAGDAAMGAGITGLIGVGMRARGVGGSGPSNPELINAAQRQGVDILPADVGGTMTQRLTGGIRQSIFGSGPVARAAERAATQAGGRVEEIARDTGRVLRQENLGEVAQRGAQRYIDQSGQVGRSLYQEADDLSRDVIAQAPTAFRNLNSQLRELSATAPVEGDIVPALQRFRSVIADESGLHPLDVQSMRRLRTRVAAEGRSAELRGTDYTSRANRVLEDVRADISRSLSPEARASFERADTQWRERLNTIDDVMARVIGNSREASPEAVANRLTQMSRGDSARLGRFLSEIPPEDAGSIRASLINEIGRAPSGQQGAAGDSFSLSTFLTNWDRLPERSRGLLFRGDSRQAIEDIATIAEGARMTSRMANTSNTAGATNVSDAIRHVSAYSAFGSLGVTAIVENLTGRLLASPGFARWLARTPQEPGRAIRALRRVAVAEPSLTSNINTLLQAVQRAANDNVSTVTRAAASGDGADPQRNQ